MDDDLNAHLREVERHEPLNRGEVYGFFPPLQIGGSYEVESHRRVGAREHWSFIDRLEPFVFIDVKKMTNSLNRRRDVRVYDINILSERADRNDPLLAGWCFGLPPGIHPYQWPLDPCNGYPLAYGFTISLPEDYRCRGDDFVALSFFGTPEDMDIGEGGPFIDELIAEVSRSDAPEPEDFDLKPFWLATQHRHPRLYRLGGEDFASYAAIFLTREEYGGMLCMPPTTAPNRYRDQITPPAGLTLGTATAAVRTANDTKLANVFAGMLETDPWIEGALRLSQRLDDPNAGMSPCSSHSVHQTGYEVGYYQGPDGGHGIKEWAKRGAWTHFGGTMRPGQNIPSFSPQYIEFEQYLGGF